MTKTKTRIRPAAKIEAGARVRTNQRYRDEISTAARTGVVIRASAEGSYVVLLDVIGQSWRIHGNYLDVA